MQQKVLLFQVLRLLIEGRVEERIGKDIKDMREVLKTPSATSAEDENTVGQRI